MNSPAPNTLINVAKTLQNGGPKNTLIAPLALPVSGAFEISKAAREKAEALKTELPATPFDVDTSKWDDLKVSPMKRPSYDISSWDVSTVVSMDVAIKELMEQVDNARRAHRHRGASYAEEFEKAVASQMELPATPFDVDTSKWGLERISQESLATAQDQLSIIPPSNDTPTGP